MHDEETINYVDDINLEDVRDNKNLKITAKKKVINIESQEKEKQQFQYQNYIK